MTGPVACDPGGGWWCHSLWLGLRAHRTEYEVSLWQGEFEQLWDMQVERLYKHLDA